MADLITVFSYMSTMHFDPIHPQPSGRPSSPGARLLPNQSSLPLSCPQGSAEDTRGADRSMGETVVYGTRTSPLKGLSLSQHPLTSYTLGKRWGLRIPSSASGTPRWWPALEQSYTDHHRCSEYSGHAMQSPTSTLKSASSFETQVQPTSNVWSSL